MFQSICQTVLLLFYLAVTAFLLQQDMRKSTPLERKIGVWATLIVASGLMSLLYCAGAFDRIMEIRVSFSP